MSTLPPEAQETAAAAASSTALTLKEVTGLEIATTGQYEVAGDFLRKIKSRLNEVEAERKHLVQPFQEGVKRINALFRPAQDNLANAEKLLKAGMLDWQGEQSRIAQEEEARLREVARKEAEKLEKKALKAEEKGHDEQAAVLRDIAETIPTPIVAPPPKAYGTTTRQTWRAEVTDKMALIKAVAENKVPSAVLEPNMTVLNSQARSLKETMDYPGVKAVAEGTLVVRDPEAKPRTLQIPTGRPRNRKAD